MKNNLNLFSLFVSLFLCPATLLGLTIEVPSDAASVQQGIDQALSGDTVLVSPGTYAENLDFKGKDIVLASLFLFSQDEAHIDQTILDGNNIAPTITLQNGESSNAQIIGFSIIGGTNHPLIQQNQFGGGIVCLGASPIIWKNKIFDCTNIVFSYSDFGGIYCEQSNAQISENTITNITGHFTHKLGGIVANGSNLKIFKNRISVITGGYVNNGGGIAADSSSLNLSYNAIDSCAFDAAPYTASVKLFNCESILTFNTLIGEVALNEENTINLVNNIIQSPSETIAIAEMMNSNASISASYNNIQGGWSGTGNLDTDPMFVDPDNKDYHLQAQSPCIDSGDPASDPDPDATQADMGAYYFNQGGATGINDLMESFQLYPNPAHDFVELKWAGTMGMLRQLILTDMLGRIQIIPFESRASGHIQIDLNGLSPGLYLIQGLNADNNIWIQGQFIRL